MIFLQRTKILGGRGGVNHPMSIGVAIELRRGGGGVFGCIKC